MWSRVCLGKVATINMGQSPPSSTVNEDGNGLPFIQGNAEFGPRNPLPVKFCSKPQKQARPGDILLSVRAPVGALNLANKTLCIGRGLSAITPTKVDAEFLWHALHREVSDLARVSQGSTFNAVNKADLFRLEIPLPLLPGQRKIAAILSSVDGAIEETQAVIDQVQVVKRGLMQQLLTRGLPGRHTRFKQTEIGEIPEDWGSPALGDIASIGNGTTPSKKREDYWQDGTIPWLPTGKVNDRIVQSASVYVTEKAILETPLRVLPINTLLIAMIGQGKTRGKTAILKIKACINQNFAYVIPLRQISSRFLFYVLEHQYVALRASGRGSNQDALNCQIISVCQ